jgi:arylsulfatase A-like enzyme
MLSGRSSRPILIVGLSILVALILVALVLQPFKGSGSSGEPSASGETRDLPNVLIFITDDQRVEAMEALPETSRYFKDEGIWYPNAFATTPVCCPSRASIFTGQFVHNHGVKQFQPYELDQTTTLQAALQDSGYRTGFFGKYLNSWSLADDPPHFDEWAFFPQSTRRTYLGRRWRVDDRITNVGKYSTESLGDSAVDFIKKASAETTETPWLMYVSTPAAHLPFVAQQEFRDAPVEPWEGNDAVFERDKSDKPPWVRQPTKGKCNFRCGQRTRRQQFRTLMSVDSMVGRVMRQLTALDQAENTIAFFVSDNGIMWGEHGVANKRWPYSASVRVPLGVRWPAGLDPGSDERLVATVDIAPTVLDAVGVSSANEHEMDGRSLLDQEWERDEMLLEHWPAGPVPAYASILGEDHQYVEYYARNLRRVIFREYYDLANDPWQLENLLAEPAGAGSPDRATLRALSRRLNELRRCQEEACP